jgi:hypothetical protein
MPLLKLGKNGEIYESDSRLNGAEGMGRQPEMVEDYNMLELSVVENDKVIKDREALKKLDNDIRKNNQKKYAHSMAKLLKKQQQDKLKQEKEYQARKKLDHLQNLRNGVRKMQAIHQSNYMNEKLAGVSGYGLSTDGRKPYLDRPSVDYKPSMPADYAFGGNAEDWGNTMGQLVTAVAAGGGGGSSAPTTQLVSTQIVETSIEGEYTTRHQFIIEQFEKNLFSFQYTYTPQPQKIYSIVVDQSMKNQINAKNQLYNTAAKVIEAAGNKWMYSGWPNEDGSWTSVKVPFVYGLPMDLPNNADTKKRDLWRNHHHWSDIYDTQLFAKLKPVIEAYALFFKNQELEKQKEIKRLEYEALQAATRAADDISFRTMEQATGSAIDKATDKIEMEIDAIKRGKQIAVGNGGFTHPMLRYGLLKSR